MSINSFIKSETIALFITICIGTLISILPNICQALDHHAPIWIADDDELLYLAWASQSYFHHPLYLGDPVNTENQGTSFYPWIQLGPFILLAYLFKTGPLSISIYLHLFAGLSFSVSSFYLFKCFFKTPLEIACSTLIFLSNSSSIAGTVIFKNFYLLFFVFLNLNSGYLFNGMPHIFPSYRLITPALSIFSLFIFLCLFTISIQKKDSRRLILYSGLTYGCLFYVLFYYWTSVTLALGLYALIDRSNFRNVFITGFIGVAIGLPELISGYLIKLGPTIVALHRTKHFIIIDRFQDLETSFIIYIGIILTGYWVYCYRKDLLFLWILAFSALILRNHQILTSTQIQNYHYMFIYGELLAVLQIIFAFDLLKWMLPLFTNRVLLALSILMVVSGLLLRAKEGQATENSRDIRLRLASYQSEHMNDFLMRNQVIAGDRDLQNICFLNDDIPLIHQAAWFSPEISDEELDRRIALNQYLSGEPLDSFIKNQSASDFGWDRWGPDRNGKVESRTFAFKKDMEEPLKDILAFKVRYVALTNTESLPSTLAPYCKLIKSGVWNVYEIHDPYIRSSAAAPHSN